MLATDPKGKWAVYASHLGSYMRRWIIRTPWFTLRLHNIRRSDAGRDFHDHPFNFTSIILRGGYVEHVPGCSCYWFCGVLDRGKSCKQYRAGSVVRRKAETFHRLELGEQEAWTFVISSRYFREWGFLLRDGSWIHYKLYKGDA